jgi:hypothetical protein
MIAVLTMEKETTARSKTTNDDIDDGKKGVAREVMTVLTMRRPMTTIPLNREQNELLGK